MGQVCLDWKMDRMGVAAEEIAETTAAAVPLRRNCTEADVINAIMFFIDDDSGFLTGQALDVDGGMLSTGTDCRLRGVSTFLLTQLQTRR